MREGVYRVEVFVTEIRTAETRISALEGGGNSIVRGSAITGVMGLGLGSQMNKTTALSLAVATEKKEVVRESVVPLWRDWNGTVLAGKNGTSIL